jgi:iron complex outermembrane receptor protein
MVMGFVLPLVASRHEAFDRRQEDVLFVYEEISSIRRVIRLLGCVLLLLLFCLCPAARSQAPQNDLADLRLEDLMNIEVTSVSKKVQRVSQTGAAIFVITAEDIRRSGALNVPDVLRMVPGVDVAQLDANIWVITIRGFSDRFADKVLVLIDGRTAYTPTSSGVYWDQQDVPLEDVERIEVIRGPGGTIWGANAVNGVISITTKVAKATPGGLISATAGSQESTEGLLQYGRNIGKIGAYRVFGKYFGTGSQRLPDDTPGVDGWHLLHGGFRSDLSISSRETATIQGDFVRTRENELLNVVLSNALPQQPTFVIRKDVSAGSVLARWTHVSASNSEISAQGYYDGYDRHEEGGYEGRRMFDMEFQDHARTDSAHDIVWGLGFRTTSDNLLPKYSKRFDPSQRVDNLFTGFLQDEITLTDSLHLVVGSRLERNAYTGIEFEPGAQLVWSVAKGHAAWVSAARAIRQPARADTAIRIDVATVPVDPNSFGVVEIIGDPTRKAEELIGYQIGYRAELSQRLSLDFTSFWNRYHHLQTDEPAQSFFTSVPPPPHFVFPEISSDHAHARTYGAEAFANWNVTQRWRISPGYAFLQMRVRPDESSQNTSVAGVAGDAPKHSFQMRSQVSLPHRVDWDVSLYYVGALPDQGVTGYDRVDTRLGWRLGESFEFSVAGQNLLTPRHDEFGDDAPLHTRPQRNVFVKIAWRIP